MDRRAFTLIELLVVISIIALLSSVVLSSINTARDKGKLAAGKQFSANLFHVAAEQAIGIWELSECAGTVAGDRSGNGYNVNLTGSPSWPVNDNPYGNSCSLALNGTSQYGNLSTSAFDRTSGQELSVSVWVKPSRLAGQYQGIVGSRQSQLNWYLYQHTTDGSIQLHGSAQYKSTYIPQTGVWTHIAAVVDSSGTSKLYANGALVFTTSGYTFGPAAGQLVIGTMNAGTELFQGNLDEIRVFSKTLTASEIQAIYAAGAPAHSLAAR